jgi:hypothetical protein
MGRLRPKGGSGGTWVAQISQHRLPSDPPERAKSCKLPGGFARVYQVRDTRNNYLACKVVTKSLLKAKNAKTKVRTHCVRIVP